jgi:hypothetical protein
VWSVPRRWRRRILPRYWPVSARAIIGRADEQEIADLLNARRKERERRETHKRLKQLAGDYERLIINALTRVGVSHVTHEERHKKVAQVRFMRPTRISSEAIYFQVDTARLPWHTNITMLQDPATIATICAACGRRVRWLWPEPESGFWFVVELKQGVRGIPREVDYAQMLSAIKPDAPRLLIPIGVGEAGRMYYRDIADMPHVLIGGATNQGKSVWMKQALVTLMLRNDPSRLKLIMIDLKGGVELSQFKDVPHLLLPLIKEKHGVIPALEHVMKEVKRRLAVFESRNAVNISNYNQRNKKKMDYWVVVVDELANLMLDKELKSESETLLADIAAQSRAAGIHLMVATQRPDASVVSGLIRANFPVRVAFSCSDYASSKVILDTTDAAGLTPVGRMIYFQGATKTELQGPLITPTMVQDKVDGISAGEAPEVLARSKKHNLTPQDLFRHALTKYDGRFPTTRIWEDLKPFGISRPEVEKTAKRFDGKEIEVDGVAYMLTPPIQINDGMYTPRRLERIQEQDDPEESPSGDASIATHEALPTEPENLFSMPANTAQLELPGPTASSDDGNESDTTDPDDEHPEPYDQFSERINSVFATQNE